MSIAGKNVKKFERWVLIGVVIILIATFSISGVTSQGCGGARSASGDDYGGTYQPAPGKTRTVTDEDVREAFARYQPVYGVFGPSLRFGEHLGRPRPGRGLVATWMHLALVGAAQEAGYRVGDAELAAAIRRLVPEWARSPRGAPPPFTAELYDRVIAQLARMSGRESIGKAEFEKTIREMLLKDKMVADLVAFSRVPQDRAADFARWKRARERVDLAFGAVPAASFLEGVKTAEATRSAISALADPLKKVVDAANNVRRLTGVVESWRKAQGGAWPADTAELLKRETGRAQIGSKMIDDPWGRPYAYEKTADAGRILSLGADGKLGTEDDVTSTTVAVLDTLTALRRTADAVKTWQGAAKDWPAGLDDVTKAPPAPTGTAAIAPPLAVVPKDGWGRDLAWDKASRTLSSAGADGAAGTADDVRATVDEQRALVPLPAAIAPLVAKPTQDAWGRALLVDTAVAGGVAFRVFSAGPNGTPYDDDDVVSGNTADLELHLRLVKSAHRVPARYEFEALYVVPSLVSDEIFAQAWAKFPEQRPDEKSAWLLFRQGAEPGVSTYQVHETTDKDAPAIDPRDPEKGYGAALRKELAEKGLLPKDAKGWPVPAPESFGDRKDPPAAGAPDLPNPDTDPLYKTYLEKGWRLVALRDQFFANLLDRFLKTARESAAAKPATPPVEPKTFASQLAELRDLQPSVDDASKGARFLQLFATKAGEPLDHKQIEALPEIGGYVLVKYLAPMKEGAYDVVPRSLRTGEVQVALRLVKSTPDHDPTLDEARDAIWEGYLESRAVARAAEELERVRADLEKKFAAKPAGEAPSPAPAVDVAARVAQLQEALKAAAAERKFEVFLDRTGPFVGAVARGSREPKPPPSATPAEKDALRRRAFVRSEGYPTVSGSGDRSTEAGTLGRSVLRDDRRPLMDEKPTNAAYLVIVAAQADPSPEEFQGEPYLEWVRTRALGAGIHVDVGDRQGAIPEALFKFYDDWDTIKHDYKIETKVDLLVGKDAGGRP
jgi:hypothetical protein